MLTQNHGRRLTSWIDTNFAIKANTVTNHTFSLKKKPIFLYSTFLVKLLPRHVRHPALVPVPPLKYAICLWSCNFYDFGLV